MNIDEAIKIKMRNRHIGILNPTKKDFEADDLSIEALKRVERLRDKRFPVMGEELPSETKD